MHTCGSKFNLPTGNSFSNANKQYDFIINRTSHELDSIRAVCIRSNLCEGNQNIVHRNNFIKCAIYTVSHRQMRARGIENAAAMWQLCRCINTIVGKMVMQKHRSSFPMLLKSDKISMYARVHVHYMATQRYAIEISSYRKVSTRTPEWWNCYSQCLLHDTLDGACDYSRLYRNVHSHDIMEVKEL